jgi:GTPase SAR1 family protein
MDDGHISTIKVCVIGDSGVGKTSLCSRLEHMTNNQASRKVSNDYVPTVGCQIAVVEMVHPRTEVTYFVELWDCGGNPRFAGARSTFFRKVFRRSLPLLLSLFPFPFALID